MNPFPPDNMRTVKTNKAVKRRLGVVLLLLAYVGQNLSVGAHAASMVVMQWELNKVANADSVAMENTEKTAKETYETNKPSCHEMSMTAIQEDTVNSSDPDFIKPNSCCDGGCSQLNCHALNAIPNDILFSGFLVAHSWVFPEYSAALHTSIKSLYRPPILG